MMFKHLTIITLLFVILFMGIKIDSLNKITPPQPASSWVKPSFTFATFEYTPTKVESVVKVTWVSDKEEVDRVFEENGTKNLLGLASYQNGECTIYAHEPNTPRTMETLGHEMAHCFRGAFHE